MTDRFRFRNWPRMVELGGWGRVAHEKICLCVKKDFRLFVSVAHFYAHACIHMFIRTS